MKNSIIFLGFLFFTFCFSAQTENKDVTITATGSGSSQEFAKQTALRNAIEQAFGTFISSKTEILNDEIVADQMSSVSSGNVKSYEVLNESQLPNGTWASTLRVIVSVDKLTSFVETRGITVEIKGGLFAMNIKQQILNEQGEINAIANMFGILHETMQVAFDYTIKSEEPKSLDAESKNWEIPLTVTSTANKNIDFCANYFMKTISAISLTQEEVDTYKSLNKNVYKLVVKPSGNWEETKVFFFRKKKSIDIISSLIFNWEFYIRLFAVQSGIDELYGNEKNGNTDFSDLFWFGDYNPYSEKFLIIKFPTTGQTAGTFKYRDKKTLSQIEQMNGYSIVPRGVVSKIRNGGYVVYEKDGHGLVVALFDIGQYNWIDAKVACDNLVLNGYNDWYLPSENELISIYINLLKKGIGKGGIKFGYLEGYWSSNVFDKESSWKFEFTSEHGGKVYSILSLGNVLPVRIF